MPAAPLHNVTLHVDDQSCAVRYTYDGEITLGLSVSTQTLLRLLQK